jgi:hypothetical protein
MAFQDFSPFKTSKPLPESLMGFGLAAAAAPLWTTYWAATGAGLTYWWASKLTRRIAEFHSFTPVAAEPIAFAEPVVEAAPEPVVEPVVETVLETATVVEPEAEPVLLDLADVELATEVEAAPVEVTPTVEAVAPEAPATPKAPKSKKA